HVRHPRDGMPIGLLAVPLAPRPRQPLFRQAALHQRLGGDVIVVVVIDEIALKDAPVSGKRQEGEGKDHQELLAHRSPGGFRICRPLSTAKSRARSSVLRYPSSAMHGSTWPPPAPLLRKALDASSVFLRFTFCAWAPLLFGAMPAPAAEDAVRRPNILFCIADDWSWPHAGAYGDGVVKTPNFDRVSREGALFTRAFCAAPSCSPSRAAILTGQARHRLAEGGNLWGSLPKRFLTYPDLLEAAGYGVGFQGKGWGPANFKAGGRERNPAGPGFKSFEEFLKSVPAGKPFCFWFGSTDPHRPYTKGAGARAGLKVGDVRVPPWLPDTPEIRDDILDYYFEVERFDRDVGELLKRLDTAGLLDSTLAVITSDNGMPFPRAKTNLHDSGSRMPLAVRWPGRVKAGQTI